MAKFCEACGTPCADDAAFCAGCGKQLNAQPAPQAPQQPQYQAPQQPQYQAPQQPQYGYQPAPAAKSFDFVGFIRQYLHIIIAAVAAFALLAGFLVLFGLVDVSATAEIFGNKQTSSGSLADLRGNSMEQIPVYIISTYVMGIVGLAAAALLGLCTYVLFSKKPLTLGGKQYGSKLLFTVGSLVLAGGSLIALLMGLFGGNYSESAYGMTASATFAVHWTYWVCVILGAGLVVIDKVLFKENSYPLQ